MTAVVSRRPLTMAVHTDGRAVGVLRRGWSGVRPVHGSACRCGDFSAYDVTTFGDAARQIREHLRRRHGLDVTGLDLGTWPFRTTADSEAIAETLRELADAWEGWSITSEIGPHEVHRTTEKQSQRNPTVGVEVRRYERERGAPPPAIRAVAAVSFLGGDHDRRAVRG